MNSKTTFQKLVGLAILSKNGYFEYAYWFSCSSCMSDFYPIKVHLSVLMLI